MKNKKIFSQRVKIDIRKNIWMYVIILPVLIYLIIFCYKPMYGIVIAFKDYRTSLGIMESPWVGFKHFKRFFGDVYFMRLLRNTLSISFLSLLFSFPASILLALLLNEVKVSWFKRTVQTITYMPHFIATVVVCSLLTTYCQSSGLFNQIITLFGGKAVSLLSKPEYFYPIYVGSAVWQNLGWNSIIFLAALAGIDQEQYEAARIDGAGRLSQIWYITLPGIVPTISMLLILNLGKVLNVGYEKIILLYQPLTYEVADVISTYTYRKGLIDAEFSYSTAVNLFNSVANILFLTCANKISKKMGQSGLF